MSQEQLVSAAETVLLNQITIHIQALLTMRQQYSLLQMLLTWLISWRRHYRLPQPCFVPSLPHQQLYLPESGAVS
jgi:hypothetical protein